MAQMMRVGRYRPYVKDVTQSDTAMADDPSPVAAVQGHRPWKTAGTLRNFGGTARHGWESEVRGADRELVENLPVGVCRTDAHCPAGVTGTIVILVRRLLAIVRDDEACRRLMTTPGNWACGSLTIAPRRHSGSLPQFNPSGRVSADGAKYQRRVDRDGRISRCGDEMMRTMLDDAAHGPMRSKKWSASRPGRCRAPGAAGRKWRLWRLPAIGGDQAPIWVDGTEFRWTREQAAAQLTSAPDQIR